MNINHERSAGLSRDAPHAHCVVCLVGGFHVDLSDELNCDLELRRAWNAKSAEPSRGFYRTTILHSDILLFNLAFPTA